MSNKVPEQLSPGPSQEALLTADLLECMEGAELDVPPDIWMTWRRTAEGTIYQLARYKHPVYQDGKLVSQDLFTLWQIWGPGLGHKKRYSYESLSEELMVTDLDQDEKRVAMDEDWVAFRFYANDAKAGILIDSGGNPINEVR